MSGTVLAIFIAPDKGVPMRSVSSAVVCAGRGLEGDRYASGKGFYSLTCLLKVRHVTLIAGEAVAAARIELAPFGVSFAAKDTRRNVLISGVDLNALVGKTFLIAGVLFEGVELAAPCARPLQLLGYTPAQCRAFTKAFASRGGLRAAAYGDGIISIGDSIRL